MATGTNNPRNIILLAALALVLAFAIGRALLAGRSSAAPSPAAATTAGTASTAPAAATTGGTSATGAATPGTAAAPGATTAGTAANDDTTIDMASLPKLQPSELRDPYQPPPGFGQGAFTPAVVKATPPKPVVTPVVPPAPHPLVGPGPLPIGLISPASLNNGARGNSAGPQAQKMAASPIVAPETPEKELLRRVVLKGVLIGPYPSAFITIDGDQQLVHKGDRLPRGYRISQITEDEMVATLGSDTPGRSPLSTVEIRQ